MSGNVFRLGNPDSSAKHMFRASIPFFSSCASGGADGTGASCLDSEAVVTDANTPRAGDEAPLVSGSPKSRKKKTTVPKTKAKKGQSGNDFQDAEATTGDQVRTEKASSEQALLATNFNSVIVRPMVGVDT